MINCPACGKPNQEHFKFCLGCGTELPQAAGSRASTGKHGGIGTAVPNDCPKCGESMGAGHRFCPSCGHNVAGGAPAAGAAAQLIAVNPDGTEGMTVPLDGTVTVGRDDGGVFADDLYLSPKHASFAPEGGHVVVTDEHSLNGIYRRLPADQRYPLTAGQLFRIGQELVRFEHISSKPPDEFGVEYMGAPSDGYVGRIAMVTGRTSTGTAFPVPETGLNLGRERGEVLFADDGYVSGLHCRLSFERGQVYLTDLGSSNGTFVRVVGSEHFSDGEVLLMGQQLFRIAL